MGLFMGQTADFGGALLVNAYGTHRAVQNPTLRDPLPWTKADSMYTDKRFGTMLLGLFLSWMGGASWLGHAGRIFGEGAGHSLVSTEVLRYQGVQLVQQGPPQGAQQVQQIPQGAQPYNLQPGDAGYGVLRGVPVYDYAV